MSLLYLKKGCRLDPSNYRPISLTSVPCKVLERIIRDHITEYLGSNKLISKKQHGFVPKKTCTTNLLETSDFMTSAIANNNAADLIFLDFAKALDTVPHRRLIHKLKAYGIDGKILVWIKSFLTTRRQRVVYNKSSSSWLPVTSSVPQGTVLAPTLFSLYINDLPDTIRNFIVLYADDSKIGSIIRSILEDCTSLQDDLTKTVNWSSTWLLKLHPLKCKVIHFGKNNPKHKYFMKSKECMPANEILQSPCERDLGILISANLKIHPQCLKVASKASSMLGLMKRTFCTRDPIIWKSIYTTYIHLEYAVQAWRPYLVSDITLLENVQRRATKVPHTLKNLNYKARCEFMNIPTLETRRNRGDILQQHKSHQGIENIDWHVPILVSKARGLRRARLLRELVKICRLTQRIVIALLNEL